MKHIILVVLGLIWAGVVSAQINIVDKGDVFEVYATGQFRSSTPKGLAYINMDAQGRLGLLRAANGSQITSYANIAAYRVNGVQYGTLEELVAALQVAIFVLPCLAADTTCTYSVEGIELEPFFCISFAAGFNSYMLNSLFLYVGSSLILIAGAGSNLNDFLDELEANITIVNDESDYTLSIERVGQGFCLRATGDFSSNPEFQISIDQLLLNGSGRPIGDGWFVDTNIDLNQFSSPPNFGWNSVLPLQFQVNINGTWTNQTPVNGTWSITTTDTVTEWRIIDANENVIDSDTLICNQ